jgi:hypothetical protein
MAKLSLLDMTQNILSALDSDPVDSIDETVEAVQVAELVKEAYFELISQRDWPFSFGLGTLTALGDINNPTKMRIPDTWNKLKWIKYNKKDVTYIQPEEFQTLIDTRVVQAGVVNTSGFIINSDPVYWTSYDDTTIVFDGINKALESTLQASNSVIYGTVQANWSHVDTFVPSIPEKFFPTLLAEAKSQSFVNLKQQSNAREERKATRGRQTMRNEAWRNESGEIKYNTKVNYGRK